MSQSVKEYFAAFGRWGFFVAALVVGDVIGIIQSYARDWILPQQGWWLILVGILLLSPFIAFHKLRLKRDELQNQLDEIKNARPNIELVGIENIQATIRNVATGDTLGTPVFTQVKFANNRSTPSLVQAGDALNVVGHIDIYTQDGKCLFNMIGRWSETKEEALGAQPTEMEQITIPANGRPNPMDIVLKYHEDQDCYGHTNKGRKLAPTDWRDKQKRLPVGTYLVKVHLRGSNVDKEFWLNLVNKGARTDIELQALPILPLIPDKEVL